MINYLDDQELVKYGNPTTELEIELAKRAVARDEKYHSLVSFLVDLIEGINDDDLVDEDGGSTAAGIMVEAIAREIF